MGRRSTFRLVEIRTEREGSASRLFDCSLKQVMRPNTASKARWMDTSESFEKTNWHELG